MRKKLLKRIGPSHCVPCDALPEVIEASHIRPVKDNGGDQSGNGIWLCKNQHLFLILINGVLIQNIWK